MDHEQRRTHEQHRESADSDRTEQSANKAVCCTAQLVKTSREGITLQVGNKIADVHGVTKTDLV